MPFNRLRTVLLELNLFILIHLFRNWGEKFLRKNDIINNYKNILITRIVKVKNI